MANKYTREKIFLPKTIKPRDRVKIAEFVIDHIVARSLNGLDKNNKKFPNYEIDYANKKNVGVGDVDLTLSGEMLESLELVSHKPGEIIIGYKDPSDELAGKVEGNRIGSYGREPNKDKARDFLGIPEDELDILIGAMESKIDLTRKEVDPFDTISILDQLLEEEFGS